MPVIVTLLRGVNVGGHHKIKMETCARSMNPWAFAMPKRSSKAAM